MSLNELVNDLLHDILAADTLDAISAAELRLRREFPYGVATTPSIKRFRDNIEELARGRAAEIWNASLEAAGRTRERL